MCYNATLTAFLRTTGFQINDHWQMWYMEINAQKLCHYRSFFPRTRKILLLTYTRNSLHNIRTESTISASELWIMNSSIWMSIFSLQFWELNPEHSAFRASVIPLSYMLCLKCLDAHDVFLKWLYSLHMFFIIFQLPFPPYYYSWIKRRERRQKAMKLKCKLTLWCCLCLLTRTAQHWPKCCA